MINYDYDYESLLRPGLTPKDENAPWVREHPGSQLNQALGHASKMLAHQGTYFRGSTSRLLGQGSPR